MTNKPVFISGIGTGSGKTIISAIVVEALQADYWKPIQCGFEDGTDNMNVKRLLSNKSSQVYNEVYKLKLPASPHIAARVEHIQLSIENIYDYFCKLSTSGRQLIIEGAGGLMVPLNENEFVIGLIKKLEAKVILVSRNYLGSINHSLLTALVCKQNDLNVAGWIFNDNFMDYEDEIVQWSGYTKIASIPHAEALSKEFIYKQAALIKESLLRLV